LIAGEVPEYPTLTRKYLGEEAAKAWSAQYAQMFPRRVRLSI